MKKRHLLALAALSGLGLLPMAQASDDPVDDRWYVAPFGNLFKPAVIAIPITALVVAMGFGKMIDEHFNVELKGFYQNAGGEGMHPNNSGARTYLTRVAFTIMATGI